MALRGILAAAIPLGLVAAGAALSGPLAGLRCGWPGLEPLVHLMVTLPAAYTAILVVEAEWRKSRAAGRGGRNAETLRTEFARSLAEAASRLPRLLLASLAIGLAARVLLLGGQLVTGTACTP